MHCSKLVTVREAAEDLGCSPESVRRYIHQGVLPAEKVGSQWLIDTYDLDRIDEEEVEGEEETEDEEEVEGEEEADDEEYDDDGG